MTERPEREDEEAPSGMPAQHGEAEAEPLGAPKADPEGEGEPARGEEAMPGIPTEGEPPSAG